MMVYFDVLFVIVTSVVFWAVALKAAVDICRRALALPQVNWRTLARKWINTATAEGGAVHVYVKVVAFGLAARAATVILAWLILATAEGNVLIREVFEAFNRWDAPHYLTLAQTGYTWTENGRNILLVFFPLYPYLVRLVSMLTGSVLAAGFTVSYVTFCLGLVYVYKLARLDFDAGTAWLAVVLVCIAPHGFFFGAPYTESLFLLVTAMTLYYIRQRDWMLAGVAGGLAAFSRMVGVIFIIVAIAEIMLHHPILKRMRHCAWILLMPVGSLAYLYINWRVSGDAFRFMYYQADHWHNTSQYFGATMLDQFRLIADFGAHPLTVGTLVPNVLAFTLAIGLLLYACVSRLNVIYIVYTVGYILVSFAPSWLLSGGRYMVACVPLFIFLAHFMRTRPLWWGVVPAVSLGGLAVMMGMFIRGGSVF